MFLGAILSLAATGCGPGGPAFHPVRVTLAVPAGDVAALAGSTVDIAVDGDHSKRASGTIGADGRAELETLHAGRIRRGVQEGKYRARIVLSDDDREAHRKAAKAVPAKYLDFKTSGLTVTVPEAAEITLTLTSK